MFFSFRTFLVLVVFVGCVKLKRLFVYLRLRYRLDYLIVGYFKERGGNIVIFI